MRVAAVIVVAGLAMVLGAAPAFAHTRLVSSSPADGAALATGPGQVTLVFNQEMKPEFATISVVGPDGEACQVGAVTGGGKSVSTQLRPLGPAGRYEVGYRVLSQDGHPITGKLAFTLTSPGSAASSTPVAAAGIATPAADAATGVRPAASSTGSDGAPIWSWLLGGVAAPIAAVVAGTGVGTVVVATFGCRGRSPRSPPPSRDGLAPGAPR